MPQEMDVNALTQSIMQQWPSWVSTAMVGFFLFLVFWIGGMLFKQIWIRLAHRPYQQLRLMVMLVGHTGKFLLTLIGTLTGLGTAGVDLNAVIA